MKPPPRRADTPETRRARAALAGATIVLTRPAGTAKALSKAVRARGGEPIALPGLGLRAVRDRDAAQAQLRDPSRNDGWIFTSPNAVRYAFRLAPSLRIPPHALVCGVGTGTRRALARHGVAAIAPHARTDSEGLLALPELAEVRGRRIALVGAPGGRDLIAATLRARGAHVAAAHVYERVPPRLTRRHFEALARARDPLVTLVSSGEALSNLAERLPAEAIARLRRQMLVVSSERLAARARVLAFVDVHVARSALPVDLLDAAQAALARHRL